MANDEIRLPKLPEAHGLIYDGPMGMIRFQREPLTEMQAMFCSSMPVYIARQVQDYARAAVLADREMRERDTRASVLAEAVRAIEGIQWPVGNSAAGEMAAEWTGEKLREARDAVLALAAPVQDVAPSDAEINELACDFDECKTMRDIRGFARALLSRYRAAPQADVQPNGQALTFTQWWAAGGSRLVNNKAEQRGWEGAAEVGYVAGMLASPPWEIEHAPFPQLPEGLTIFAQDGQYRAERTDADGLVVEYGQWQPTRQAATAEAWALAHKALQQNQSDAATVSTARMCAHPSVQAQSEDDARAVAADVEAVLGLLEEREYAEQWAKSALGGRLEAAITDLHNEIHAARDLAGPTLTDDQIVEVWQSMPGGHEGWLKQFGFIQFARAVIERAARAQQDGGDAA